MELSDVLRKVRGLVSKTVENGCTPEEEAQAQRAADALMLKYAIDQALLNESRPEAEKSKPEVILIERPDVMFVSWVIDHLAKHCRCKVRHSYPKSKIYGFESDLRFFELLYTETMLHMVKVLAPKWDPSLSVDANSYNLHEAGYNWLQIAQEAGWSRRYGEKSGQKAIWERRDPQSYTVLEESTEGRVGSSFKRACYRAAAALGENAPRIAAGGTATYRSSAADGYTDRIEQRLREAERERPVGYELVLHGQTDSLEAFFREQNEDLFRTSTWTPPPPCPRCQSNPSGHCRQHPPGRIYRRPETNMTAYQRGVDRANELNLHVHRAAGDSGRKGVE